MTPPAPPTPAPQLSTLEKILLGLLAAAPITVPIFIHSTQGLMIFNASEILVASVLQEFAPTA